jgi:uncharacterized C2H2 Zn-finger protein
MPNVKVYNDNFLDYKENFEDEQVYIKANGFIIMDEEKAYLFKGKAVPMLKDGGGRQKPESYKKIRVVPFAAGEEKRVSEFKCQACSFVGEDKKSYDAHVNDMHLEQLIDKDEKDKRMKAQK